jgi:hypothetical protein
MGVFGHVMGTNTAWGAEQHHSDYEDYVEERTNSYSDSFNSFLVFDGALTVRTAYDAAIALANNTTFDGGGSLTCAWMDTHYNWNDATFKNRAGESLNLAVNMVADVLHTFSVDPSVPEFPAWALLPLLLFATLLVAVIGRKAQQKRAS